MMQQLNTILQPLRLGWIPLGSFQPNGFSQVVINPYKSPPGGDHNVWVTNRVPIPIPERPVNPQSAPPNLLKGAGLAVADALMPDLAVLLNFKAFLDQNNQGFYANPPAAFLDFLMHNNYGRGMYALVDFVLATILPVGDRLDVSYRLTDVLGFGGGADHDGNIKSLSIEAAFDMANVWPFVDKVLDLVNQRLSQNVLIGGYLSLRVVGVKTSALLGMQRFSPTCFVEYAILAGSSGVDQFVHDLQRLAIDNGGILHWGQCNDVMTSGDIENAYTKSTVELFRQVRRRFTRNGELTTFNNTFTERFKL